MSLYIVEDDDDNMLDSYGEFDNSVINAMLYDEPSGAERDVDEYGGHVVELVEAPVKVVVSEEEAEMLEQAKCDDDPAELIVGFVNSHDEYDDDHKVEDRLMRAYVNGWTVEKQKRWNVKVPHTQKAWYYQYGDTDLLTICPADKELRGKFTDAEIEHYGLQDCEKVECDNLVDCSCNDNC